MHDPVSEWAAKSAALAPDDRSRLIDLLLVSLNEAPLPTCRPRGMTKSNAGSARTIAGETEPIDGEEVLTQARRLVR